jgi:hypothetical protein
MAPDPGFIAQHFMVFTLGVPMNHWPSDFVKRVIRSPAFTVCSEGDFDCWAIDDCTIDPGNDDRLNDI